MPPIGVDVLATPGGVILRRTWFNRWVIIPMIFAAGWDVFAVFFYRLTRSLGPVPVVAMAFPVAGLVLAVGLTYAMLAAVMNRTEVTVSPGGVQVAVGPLPWPGNKVVASAQIRNVRVRLLYMGRGGRTYRVVYLDPQRRERSLLSGVTSAWAELVAATIRQHLRLPSDVG